MDKNPVLGVLPPTSRLAVSFGCGTNSTALLCGFRERDICPDVNMFADTGAEQPHTYQHLAIMRTVVHAWWGLEIITVRKLYQGQFEGLEGKCRRLKQLPGLAYGTRSCSVGYKGQPQDNELRRRIKLNQWATPVRKAMGIDVGESHRARPTSPMPAVWMPWYPLIEWRWNRDDCIATILRHGLPLPGKSSCFLCPAMKPSEVLTLGQQHPELLARALDIEHTAQASNKTPRGLGGQGVWWQTLVNRDQAQHKLLLDLEPVHPPCECLDG